MLLLFSLILGLASTQAAVWSIGGDFNEWDTSTVIEMKEQADGTFTITMPTLKGLFRFIEGDSWMNNVGALYYPDINGNCTVLHKKWFAI